MKTAWFSLIFIAAFLPAVFGAELLTLEKALIKAFEKNPQIEIARNTAAIAHNQSNIGNADLLPGIGLSGSISYLDGEGAAASENPTNTISAQVQANYTLFDGFGNLYRFKTLREGDKAGQMEARAQIERILLEVSDAYFNAASAYENFEIARELVQISSERLARSKQQSVFGRARTIDVLSATVDLNTDSVTLSQARLQWDQSRRNLNYLLHQNIDAVFTVDTSVVFNPMPSLETLHEKAGNDNATLLAAGHRKNKAEYEWKTALSAHLPRLDLSASYGYSRTNNDLHFQMKDPDKSFRAGLSLSFNLFNGFQTSINRQNAKLLLKNQKLLEEQTLLALEKDINNAYQAYQNSLQVYDLENRSLEVAKLNFIRTRELQQLGQVNSTQFREAQLNLIRSRSSLAAAKYEAKLNEMILLQYSGSLISETMQQ